MNFIESRNILVVAAVGRRTHITPLLEICRALHGNGHQITLAGMEGQLYNLPDFIQKTYIVCRAMDKTKDEAVHHQTGEAVPSSHEGRKTLASTLMFFDSFSPEIYQNLKPIIAPRSGTAKIDFVLADFFEIAAVDLALEFNVPYATCTPQLSFPMGRATFIPGLPGLQQHILTSEQATLSQRIYETWISFLFLVDMLPWFRVRTALRKRYKTTELKDRAHLHLVNSFWGFETPRALPPLMCLIGPLIPNTWSALTPEISEFLSGRSCVVYVAFGTLASLTPIRFSKLWDAIQALLKGGQVDGVIWSIKKIPDSVSSVEDVFGKSKDILFMPWVPQRAVLAHGSTKLFISHAGPTSVFESMYHAVPILCMPIHGDQNANALRCEANGLGLRLDKHKFTVEEAVKKATLLLEDRDGQIKNNCLRMQRIAIIRANTGLHEAAAKIQEVLFDHELRLERLACMENPRPPHLEMPTARMGFLKRNNVDLYTIGPFIGLYHGIVSGIKRFLWQKTRSGTERREEELRVARRQV